MKAAGWAATAAAARCARIEILMEPPLLLLLLLVDEAVDETVDDLRCLRDVEDCWMEGRVEGT